MGQVTHSSVGTRELTSLARMTGINGVLERIWRIMPMRRFIRAGFIARATVLGLLALIISGFGHVVSNPGGNESREVTELVESLIDRRADYVIDADAIATRLGYTPIVESGAWVNPDGSCSTPLPVGPDVFIPPCRGHDLGYDALRLAAGDDSGLGAWARLGLDARLYSDLLETCHDTRCRATAAVYFGAVTVNSIRQGYGSPTDEPVLPWAGLGLGIVGLAALRPSADHLGVAGQDLGTRAGSGAG